jgi:hypothetical protein
MIKMIGSGIPSSHNSNPRPMFHLSFTSRRCRGIPARFDPFVGNAIIFPRKRLQAADAVAKLADSPMGLTDLRVTCASSLSRGLLSDDGEATLVHWGSYIANVVDSKKFLIAAHERYVSRACQRFSTSMLIATSNEARQRGSARAAMRITPFKWNNGAKPAFAIGLYCTASVESRCGWLSRNVGEDLMHSHH